MHTAGLVGMMRWLTLLLVLTVAGCGFHLRGAWQGAAPARPALVTVFGDNRYGELIRELDEALRLAGLQDDEAVAARQLSLEVLDEQHTRRIASRSGNLQAAEHELRSSVSYLITRGDQLLLAPVHVEVERVYEFDSLALTGNSEQEEQLRSEMLRELAGRILRRTRALLDQIEEEEGE